MLLLRIFINDLDCFRHRALYKMLLDQARTAGIAGCTVFRGLAGDISLEGAGELPAVLEVIDTAEKIQAFLLQIKPMISENRVVEEKIEVINSSFPTDQKGKSMADRDYVLVRIFMEESDHIDHTPLYLVVLNEARGAKMAGCTVFRGIAGYGANSILHTDRLFRVSSDLPVVLEIVDRAEAVHGFLDIVRPIIQNCLVVESKVLVRNEEIQEQRQRA